MGLRSLFNTLVTPSSQHALGTLVAVGIAVGVIGVPTFNYAVHETSTDEFCLLCHARDIELEYAGTAHDSNRTGIRVSCQECHLPRAYWPKLIRKTQSGIHDIYHHMLGTIDTPEKFEAHRMEMAIPTWDRMKANDSSLCRHCHDQSKWDLAKQSAKSREFHTTALSNGKTCIDCHKGLAHKLPPGIREDEQIGGVDY